LSNSIDSLMLIYRDTRQTDMNKNPVWNSYKEKAVQVIFRVSREAINIERSTKIYVLNSNTGEFTDQRLKSGIESILYKAISFNDPEYRCLSRRSTLETSVIIENGKIVKFIK